VPNAGSAPWMTETGSDIMKSQLRKARIGGSRDNTFVRKEFNDYVRGRNFRSTRSDPEEVMQVRRPTANTPVDVINAAVDIVKTAIEGAMGESPKINQPSDVAGTAEQMVEMEKSAADEITADDDFETQIVIDRDEAPDGTTEPHVAETTDVSQERQAEASPSATASPPPSSPPEIVQEPATTTTTEITTTSLDQSSPVNENRLSAGQSEVDLMSLLSPVPGRPSWSTEPSLALHPSLNVQGASHLSFNSIRAEIRDRKSSEKPKPSQRVRIGKTTETTDVNFNHQMNDEWRIRMKGMINRRRGSSFDYKNSDEWSVYERYA